MQSVSSRQLFSDGYNDFFRNAEGRSIKFRIQPGLSSPVKRCLEDGITSHGGVVISKIPVRGMVVIHPKSRVGEALVCEWEWKERPGRIFVPFTFVLQCINEGRLLPVEENTLKRKHFAPNRGGNGVAEGDLPGIVKNKLALHLAKVFPNERGKRSSNSVYRNIIKNKHLYPWAGDQHWKTLRNSYCKNKKDYDKLISSIITKNNSAAKALPPPLPFSGRGQFLIAKNAVSSSKPSVIEVVLPRQKKAETQRHADKKSKIEKAFLIERKRKFGNDLTNAGAKRGSAKRLRTIDEMLRAPLPPIIAERTKKGPSTKRVTISASTPSDVSDVELGRAPQPNDQLNGMWIGGDLCGDRSQGKENNPGTATGSITSRSHDLDRFHNSLLFYRLDLDDLRSAAALDRMDDDSDADAIDETSVLELLRIPTTITEEAKLARTADSAPWKRTTRLPSGLVHFGGREDPETVAIRKLAENTHFTVEEVEQKFVGFARDIDKTRDFFLRCRRLIDDLFIGNTTGERAADLKSTAR